MFATFGTLFNFFFPSHGTYDISWKHAIPTPAPVPNARVVKHTDTVRRHRKRMRAASPAKITRLIGGLNLKQKKHILRKLRAQVRDIDVQASADGSHFRDVITSGTWKSATPLPPRASEARKRRPARQPPISRASSISPSDARELPLEDEPLGPAPPSSRIAIAADIAEHISSLSECRLDPRRAYVWFHTVRTMVLSEGRADYTLDHACPALQLVFMVVKGWITLDECLTWADGRSTLGKGLICLATIDRVVFKLEEGISQPSEKAVRKFYKGWMKGHGASLRYNWDSDTEDRERYGPFGPELAQYTTPDALEDILELLSDPDVYPNSVSLPGKLQTLFSPIFARSRTPQETKTEQSSDEKHADDVDIGTLFDDGSPCTGKRRERSLDDDSKTCSEEKETGFPDAKRAKRSESNIAPSRRKPRKRSHPSPGSPYLDPFLSFDYAPESRKTSLAEDERVPPQQPPIIDGYMDICAEIPSTAAHPHFEDHSIRNHWWNPQSVP